jgi:hypothetical protein
MASLRKKYQHLQVDNSKEPVSTAPVTEQAKPPEPISDAPKPAEEIAKVESNPVEAAAKSELLKRVKETERAAEYAQQRAQQQPPPQQFAEPETPAMEDDPRTQFEAAIQHLPERAKSWYRKDPSWLLDPERAAHIQYVHHVAMREAGSEGTDEYYERMEDMLGVRNSSPQTEPARPLPDERPRSAPVRPRYAAPVSAPPSRETASVATGRYVNERTALTREELEVARASKISPEEYQKQKQKMLRLKAAGVIQDGN